MELAHEPGCAARHTRRQACRTMRGCEWCGSATPSWERECRACGRQRPAPTEASAAPPQPPGRRAKQLEPIENPEWLVPATIECIPIIAVLLFVMSQGGFPAFVLSLFGGWGWLFLRTRRFDVGCGVQLLRGVLWVLLFYAALAAYTESTGAPCSPRNIPDVGSAIDDCYRDARRAVYGISGFMAALSLTSAGAIVLVTKRQASREPDANG